MAPETLTLDLGEDRAAAVADEPQSGLGKGLAAILAATAVEKPRRGGLASLIPDTAESLDEPTMVTPPTLGHGATSTPPDLGVMAWRCSTASARRCRSTRVPTSPGSH